MGSRYLPDSGRFSGWSTVFIVQDSVEWKNEI